MTTFLAIADALGYTAYDVVNGDIGKGPFRGDNEMAELFWDTTPEERKILMYAATVKLKEIRAKRLL